MTPQDCLCRSAAASISVDWFFSGRDGSPVVCPLHNACAATRAAWDSSEEESSVPFFGINWTKAEFDEVASSMQQLSRNQLHALAREQKELQSDDRGDEQRESEEEEQEEEDPCDIFAEFGTSPSQWLKAHPKAPEVERELVAMMD